MTADKIPPGSVSGVDLALEMCNMAVKPFTTDSHTTMGSITRVPQLSLFL